MVCRSFLSYAPPNVGLSVYMLFQFCDFKIYTRVFVDFGRGQRLLNRTEAAILAQL
jgi:hypothetical protein